MSNSVWVNESPIVLTEGANPIYALQWRGATVITSPSAKIFKGTSDVTGTNMSGSATALNDTITLPTIIGLIGGNDYVVSVKATVDGVLDERKIHLIVQKSSDPQV